MPKNSKGKDIAEVSPKKCSGCQICVGTCPVGAIDMVDGVAKVDAEKCIGCGKCVIVCPSDAILFDKPVKKKAAKPIEAAETGISAYKGVAVFIEVKDGAAADVSWELAGKGRELANKLNTSVMGFLVGHNVKAIADTAITYGCDSVYVLDSPAFETFISRVHGAALTELCKQVKPEVFLIGASSQGRDLSSVIATQLQTGLTADCTGLDVDPQEKLLMMTRPTFGGNIMATIYCRNHRPQMSTVRPKVFKMPKRDPARTGEIIPFKYDAVVEPLVKILETIKVDSANLIDITHSNVLVVLGKGACNSNHFPMFEELASLLGGSIACSRPLIEAGLLPYARQVGQTGKTVSPKLYIGIGVSGAVQHMVGMQGSEKVIAINNDKNAQMVQVADYSIIGDYVKVVPELIKGLKARIPNIHSQGAQQ
jgi:electron transfer flavoprotein alpha subunit